MDTPQKPRGPQSPDDAWGSLDESDDWRDRAAASREGPKRAERTATNLRQRPEDPSSLQATRGPHLVVVAGAEVGRIYPLIGKQMRVGRGERNDVVLADGSVSREHARLERRGGRWYVHDLDSGNGTFVQAKRVRSAELGPGEQVAFGHVRLQLRDVQGQQAFAGRGRSDNAEGAVGDRAEPDLAPALSANLGASQGQKAATKLRDVSAEQKPRAPGRAVKLPGWMRPELLQAVRSRPWFRAGLIAVLLVATGGWAAIFWEGRSNAQAAFHLCQRGAKAFTAQRFDDAEQAFSEARRLLPSDARAQAWAAALHRARGDDELIVRAKEALNGGELARARGTLGQLVGSPLYAKAEAVAMELDTAEKALLVEAQTALAAGLQQEAMALLARFGEPSAEATALPRAGQKQTAGEGKEGGRGATVRDAGSEAAGGAAGKPTGELASTENGDDLDGRAGDDANGRAGSDADSRAGSDADSRAGSDADSRAGDHANGRVGDQSGASRPDAEALTRWRQSLQATTALVADIERWKAKPHAKPSLWEQADGQSKALRTALAQFRRAPAAAAARATLRALGHANGAKEQQVAHAMQRFETLWETGVEEHRGKRAFAAIRLFTDAKQLALAVGGEGSAPVKDIHAKLADMYYVVGMQAFAAQKLPEAAEALRVALSLSPGHALSLRRMEELEDRAVRMVDHAEFIRKRQPARARELLRQVSVAMPGDIEVGGRARKLLAERGP